MTFSPWTSGSTRLGGRQQIWTFGIKSSVRQRSTMESANKKKIRNASLWPTQPKFWFGMAHQAHAAALPCLQSRGVSWQGWHFIHIIMQCSKVAYKTTDRAWYGSRPMLISSVPVNIRFADFLNSLASSIVAASDPPVCVGPIHQ